MPEVRLERLDGDAPNSRRTSAVISEHAGPAALLVLARMLVLAGPVGLLLAPVAEAEPVLAEPAREPLAA